jgi:hypothetical protein
MMKSGNLFFNLRACVPTSSAENFVTVALCWILASNREASEKLLRRILDEARAVGDIAGVSWSTQVQLSRAEWGIRRPDMVCECPDIVFVFEHKIAAPVDVDQIAGHRLIAAQRYTPRQIITVLIARDIEAHRHAADVCFPWRHIQSVLRQLQYAPDAEVGLLVEQFVEFLGLEGLGRIPGPCPNYWKGNILEARRRHPAFPSGYLDLGRKFGDTILPAAIEEMMTADCDGDAPALIKALRAAHESEDPPAAIWRFCRMFFPSYIKYADDHWGTTLQIPEQKGRLFAAGIIEKLDESDLDELLGDLA